MKHPILLAALLAALSGGSTLAAEQPATTAATPIAQAGQWTAWGGTLAIRWSQAMQDEGVVIGVPTHRLRADAPRLTDGYATVRQALGSDLFEIRRAGSIGFRTLGAQFDGFTGGTLQVDGGYVLTLPKDAGRIDLTHLRLRANPDNPMILDVVSQDDVAWFYIDRLMYDIVQSGHVLAIQAADLRMSRALAERIGAPYMAGYAVADVELLTELQIDAGPNAPLMPMGDPVPSHWHGEAVPGQRAGAHYQADLFMQAITTTRMRQQGVTGPEGSGKIVFAPSSTLKNNVNNGTAQTTIPNQGALGTSSALWTADIPWRQKFTGNYAPYGNDQHPFLIWNLYRINANGRIEQIARSGVKHAWLTTNYSCAPGEDHDSHILGRGCSDTYSNGNNDANQDLSLRSEIIPAKGLWGRCGSIFDPGCVGSNTNAYPSDDGYVRRMVVLEPQISASKHPGASYLFDSWYLDRDDINIYNSQASLWVTPTWNGSGWNLNNENGYKLGSVTDRWTSENVPLGVETSNKELASGEGHAKLAVRVTNLGNGQWRYDYAVHNLDFARGVTEGSEPNLRVVRNHGFDRFSVPLPAGAVVSATWFSDGDDTIGNDWSASTAGGAVTWTAPSGSPLDWGTLYAFSLTVNRAPVTSTANLRVAEVGLPASHDVETLGPATGTPTSFTVGGNLSGLSVGALVLQLNGGNDLSLNANGLFTFGTTLASGENYVVTVASQPVGQACAIANGSGQIGSTHVTNVAVTCAALPAAIFADGFEDDAPPRTP